MITQYFFKYALLFSLFRENLCSTDYEEETDPRLIELHGKWEADYAFSGISTFAHLPHVKCLTNLHEKFDIAIIGAPFDTAVSYRPGARFGPKAIRAASARQTGFGGFNPRAGVNPVSSYSFYIKIPRRASLTLGEYGSIFHGLVFLIVATTDTVPITPFDNALALRQMTEAFTELLERPSYISTKGGNSGNVKKHPTLITLGGDHSIALPALRAVKSIYGPVAVLHFDAHLDTWSSLRRPTYWPSEQVIFNHGSMFHLAYHEGLLINSTTPKNVHAGLRTRLSGDGWNDYEYDSSIGWERISTDDIDDIGVKGVIEKIMSTLGTEIPVYLSIDVDVIDPGLAPGTGTPEPGGWTTRELIRILRGVEKLNVVGVDVVEVAPAYDHAENTALVASQIVYEVLSSLVKKGLVVQEDRTNDEL